LLETRPDAVLIHWEIIRGPTETDLFNAARVGGDTTCEFTYRPWLGDNKPEQAVKLLVYSVGRADPTGNRLVELMSPDHYSRYRGCYNCRTGQGRFSRELVSRR
jgi:hypothetical protein